MSAKHSPGPWRYAPEEPLDNGVVLFEVFNAKDELVADLMGSEHDARLIAAAPQLLALARRFRTYIGDCCLPDDENLQLLMDLVPVLDRIDGEEPAV